MELALVKIFHEITQKVPKSKLKIQLHLSNCSELKYIIIFNCINTKTSKLQNFENSTSNAKILCYYHFI